MSVNMQDTPRLEISIDFGFDAPLFTVGCNGDITTFDYAAIATAIENVLLQDPRVVAAGAKILVNESRTTL